MVNVEESGTG